MWCYTQGLRGVSWDEILSAIAPFGIQPRDKDYRNWEDGMKKHLGETHVLEARGFSTTLMDNIKPKGDPRVIPDLDSYPMLDERDVGYEDTRWVPCNRDNKPLVKWSEIRCTLNEARLWPGARYLAENLKGCHWIVLDFDVDHDKNNINWELREFGLELLNSHPTQALYKPNWMGFHLTYWTDREIRTKHLPHICIDICGNSKATNGQLRYFKTKQTNDIRSTGLLTDEIWSKLQRYSLTKDVYRKVKNNEPIN